MCPPEFDVFNRATLPPESANQSSDDESIDEESTSTNKKETPSKQQKLKRISQTSVSSQRGENSSKALPESVKALKKKYTEQRIVRTAISQKLDSKRENAVKEAGIKALRSTKQMVTRNAKDTKSTS